MEWEFRNGIPIYQQIVLTMQIRIANGTYPPGSKVPAVRELALEAGVNPNTMQRALSELEREELLASIRTNGRYVTDDLDRLHKLRMELSTTFIKELFENLRQLGMTDEEIQTAVREWREQE